MAKAMAQMENLHSQEALPPLYHRGASVDIGLSKDGTKLVDETDGRQRGSRRWVSPSAFARVGMICGCKQRPQELQIHGFAGGSVEW